MITETLPAVRVGDEVVVTLKGKVVGSDNRGLSIDIDVDIIGVLYEELASIEVLPKGGKGGE